MTRGKQILLLWIGLVLSACGPIRRAATPAVAPTGSWDLVETAVPTTIPTPTLATVSGGGTNTDDLHPIVDGRTQFLLGAASNGQWLTAKQVIPQLAAQSYTLYNSTGAAGTVTGVPPAAPGGVCDQPTVTLQPESDYTGYVALDADWDALPRSPQWLSTDTAVYQQAVADLLRQQGLTEPDVQLSHVLRVDLEGDGVDEVLVGASRLVENTSLPPVAAGDYSLVMLRKVVGNSVTTIPLRLDVYPEAQDLAYPYRYEVTAVLDLNGDGILEIIIHGLRYEGDWAGIFQVTQTGAEPILIANCSL